MAGADDFDDDTDVDISRGSYSPQTVLKQKASYLISTHEANNIYANNFLTLVAVLFNEISTLNNQDRFDDDQTKQFSLAAGVACSFTFAIFWLVSLHKTHKQKLSIKEQKKFFDDIKNQLNPWYRRFKACSFLGNSVGQATIELLFLIPGVSLFFGAYKAAIKTAISAIFGILFGFIGATLFPDDSDIRYTSNDTLFHIGKDGWGRYAKSGISFGSLIGAAIGAIIGFVGGPVGIAAGIAIGGAIGGVIGFALMSAGVPFINYLINIFSPTLTPAPSRKETLSKLVELETRLEAEAKGIKIKALDKPSRLEHPNAIKNNPTRTKYMRSGLALGVYVGTIIGFILALCFPFTGATLLFIAIASAACAIVGAAVLGALGTKISSWVSSDDLGYSSFDFGMATGAQWLQPFGNAIGGVTILFGVAIEKLTDLICGIAGFIGAGIGGSYDIIRGKQNQRDIDEQLAKDLPKLTADFEKYKKEIPDLTLEDVIKNYKSKYKREFDSKGPLVTWSQRVGVFVTYGTVIGSLIGFLIGTAVGGPALGILFGLGAGAVISGVVGATLGPQIYKKYIQISEWISNALFKKTRVPSPSSTPLLSHSSSAVSLSTLTAGTPLASNIIEVHPPSTPPPPPPPPQKLTLGGYRGTAFAATAAHFHKNVPSPSPVHTKNATLVY